MPLELKTTSICLRPDFPMKANLPQNEPKMLARWEQMRIYDRIREDAPGRQFMSCTTGRLTPTGPSTWARTEQMPEGFHREVQDHGGI